MIENFINEINLIISSNKKYLPLLYLSNSNSLDLFFNQNIRLFQIDIIHKLTYCDFHNLIDNIALKYKIYGFIGDKQSLYPGKKYFFKLQLEEKEYNICFEYQDIKPNNFKLKNIYWNVYTKKFIICIGMNLFETIEVESTNFINTISENIVTHILDNFVDFLYLIKLNFIYKLDLFNNIINIYINKISTDKKFKKSIKIEYSDSPNILANVLEIIREISIDLNLSQWIDFINKNSFFNKLINDLETYNNFDYPIDTFEKYIVILIVNKSKLISNSYIKYFNTHVLKYSEKQINKESGFGDLLTNFASNIINPLENLVNQFDIFFMDKLEDYKKIKNINISSRIEKYYVTKSSDLLFIKTAIHILYVMFHQDSTKNYNLEYLKLAYIYKRYYYLNSDMIREIFGIFLLILKYLKFPNYINLDYYFSMFSNQILKDFESTKSLEIPIVKKKFETKLDSIDIIDFQDTFGLFYEFIIKNSIDTSSYTLEDFNDIFESELSNIRSNKLLSNGSNLYNDFNDDIEFVYEDEKEENNSESDFESNEEKEGSETNLFRDVIMGITSSLNNFSEELEGDELLEEDENLEDPYNSTLTLINNTDSMNEIIYKIKYKKYKNLYGKLKQVEKILDNKDFDKTILKDNNLLTDELIDLIINSNAKF